MSEPLTVSGDCMSCGVCLHMCGSGALVEARGQVVIRKASCNGCGACAPFCPIGAILSRSALGERRASSLALGMRAALDRE